MVNLLWLVPQSRMLAAELDTATTILRQLAKHKAEPFFERCGYTSASDFLKRYGRLSGAVLHQADENSIWLNPLSRHRAPAAIVNAIQQLEKR